MVRNSLPLDVEPFPLVSHQIASRRGGTGSLVTSGAGALLATGRGPGPYRRAMDDDPAVLAARPAAPRTAGPGGGSEALTTQGRIVRIRPVTAADTPDLLELNSRTTDRSLYQRFFAVNRRVADAYVERLVRPRGADHEALVAILADRVVAVAGYDRVGPQEAEIALLVEDEHQGEGLGTLLLEHLAVAARAAGISVLVADVLLLNRQMAGVFTASGLLATHTVEDGVTRFRLSTTPDEATLAAVDRREERAERASLEPLFAPRVVAVIGAGRRGGVGRAVLTTILRGEFAGRVHPVNLHARRVAGLPAYASVCDVPDPVDLAVVAVPAGALEQVIGDCARAGVPAAVILTSGLGEEGEEGAALQDRLVRTARGAGMRVVGPNCLGVVNTDPLVSLEAWFSPVRPVRGHLAVAAQSGAVAVAVVDTAGRNGLGVANVVSLGNKADVSGNDLLLRWWHDDQVRVVALYLESLGNPRKFARLARRVASAKPVLVVKGGRSAAGRRAGRSHTAAAASPDATVDALFAQAGVLRMDTVEEMLDAAQVLGGQPLPAGGRIAIVGNAGGVGVLAGDAARAVGLDVPVLSDRLRRRLPGQAGRDNPVDLGAQARPAQLRRVLDLLSGSGEVDALVVVVAATAANAAGDLLAAASRSRLPTVAVAVGMADRPVRIDGAHGHPIPVFGFPESAVRALGHAVRYGRWRRSSRGTVPELPGTRPTVARAIVDRSLRKHPQGCWLSADEGRDLLEAYGIPVVPTRTVTSASGAAAAARAFGGPVALKTADPEVAHKSDVGGVVVDLRTRAAVRAAYASITTALPERGVLVQPMVSGRVELVVGVVQEPTFGAVLMLGMGGVRTEVLDDRTFRILPLTDVDAAAVVGDFRGARLLGAFRGSPACDVDALRDLLLRVSCLADDLPEVVELDLNPVQASEHGAVVVDAKVHVARTPSAPSALLRTL